jgi:hypothetical protein
VAPGQQPSGTTAISGHSMRRPARFPPRRSTARAAPPRQAEQRHADRSYPAGRPERASQEAQPGNHRANRPPAG